MSQDQMKTSKTEANEMMPQMQIKATFMDSCFSFRFYLSHIVSPPDCFRKTWTASLWSMREHAFYFQKCHVVFLCCLAHLIPAIGTNVWFFLYKGIIITSPLTQCAAPQTDVLVSQQNICFMNVLVVCRICLTDIMVHLRVNQTPTAGGGVDETRERK